MIELFTSLLFWNTSMFAGLIGASLRPFRAQKDRLFVVISSSVPVILIYSLIQAGR
jgi:hypothetical protein